MADLIKFALRLAERRAYVGRTQPTCPECRDPSKQVQLTGSWLFTPSTDWKCRVCKFVFHLDIPLEPA